MGISLRKYTERSAKNKRSYQLRTGQMKLPVRKIEPVQYVDSKVNVTTVPDEPIIGKTYTYKGGKVICVKSHKQGVKCCLCSIDNEDCEKIACNSYDRKDEISIILARINA